MKVEVENLDAVRKKIEVILPDEQINALKETIYDELKKQAKIKGFRPGKVPKPIIISYYKDYIEDELRKRILQHTMADALSAAKVEPIVEPVVDFMEGEGRQGYTLECEVIPDIELPSYKGIDVEVEPIGVTQDEVEKRIEGLREMHAEIIPREKQTGAEKGDLVIVKYQGYDKGKPLREVSTEAYPLELGTTTLMPEFENALVGMKAGEEKDVEINFPEDYPNKDIASKTILFKVLLKEIKEKRLPEINNEFAKDLNFENMEKMKEGLAKEIEKEKLTARDQFVYQKIMDTMIGAIDIPVPLRLLEKRIGMMMQDARSRYNLDKFSDDERRNVEVTFRKDFENQARDRIKSDILISKISDKEEIKVNDSEIQEKMKKIAEDARRTYEDVKDFYERNNLMNGLKSSIIQEKTLRFLKDNAVIKEKV